MNMNAELKCKRRWLRALEIAKILFESEGYHTRYLEDVQNFIAKGNTSEL